MVSILRTQQLAERPSLRCRSRETQTVEVTKTSPAQPPSRRLVCITVSRAVLADVVTCALLPSPEFSPAPPFSLQRPLLLRTGPSSTG